MRGIFTTIKVINGIPLFLEKHAQRLVNGSQFTVYSSQAGQVLLGGSRLNDSEAMIPPRWTREKENYFTRKILNYIKDNHLINAALRVDVLENGEISCAVRDLPQSGTLVNAVTFVSPSSLPKVKQIDRRIYEQAQKFAEKKGADRAIFIEKRHSGQARMTMNPHHDLLLESTISNIISLDENEEMITPLLTTQGYKGVMREILLERKYIKEKEISVDTNAPLVLINSLRIEGVTHLDGRKLHDPDMLMEKINEILKTISVNS